MSTGHKWLFRGLGTAILSLLAFSLLNDSWPGDVALVTALVAVLGNGAFNWRRERLSRSSTGVE